MRIFPAVELAGGAPIRAGALEVRLAASEAEIEEAQRLRYRVFVEEKGAQVCAAGHREKRDFDEFDDCCDHLLVLEHGGQRARVVGTYRLLRRSTLPAGGRFYSASEFDLSVLLATDGEILELGRSCVDPDYRSRAAMQLLWRGIAAYVDYYGIRLMFGCGSLHGADPALHAATISYLYHYHLAPPELRMRALPERFTAMDVLPREVLDARAEFAALPALIKGYLRLGGYVGDGAVIDADYNTLDVGIVVKTELVTARYAQRYAGPGRKDGVGGDVQG